MATLPSPVEPLFDELFAQNNLKVSVKRDDLIHPDIMGNKWRKLKYNVQEAKKLGYSGLLTFGGAYSNHIAATAAAAHENELKSIGLIRGDELNETSNHTLRFASTKGMRLEFLTRNSFATSKSSINEIQNKYPNYYVLPEGGTNYLAIEGCAEIVYELKEKYDYLITPYGTGGTMAGILKGMRNEGKLIGISSLKGDWMDEDFNLLLKKNKIGFKNYQIMKDFHFGGYGRVSDQLIDLINRIKQKFDLQLDPIYTGKMYFGALKLIEEGFFESGSEILMIHTGGLQGIAGYNEKAKKKILV
ncbi:MAG: 1-aminocyclopropane-1-carboxylate deaminase [Flammeovirgaceae bacterium]|nr:1-aminocyclopropane-1-carboxylate deaminase [Flammeovirgaceae bacterium]MBE60770.1 1-aminocyclopropane-1-carboxylate deaminase [Flammeovirgaceae bacterium]HCX22333.1 1-aminocyclopropane-1-carboxylate deaminase [Cytophagales bacterium]|tara:strand:- start:5873 stop:6778 length:906 start_codon:yes stop_codon:yes gene_type:complete